MNEFSATGTRPRMGALARIGVVVVVIALLAGACGTNDGGGETASPAGSVGGASGAPIASASGGGGDLSGELTVWGMGNEGALMKALTDEFTAQNPDVTANITPIDWGQAVTRLQTAIAGGQTPDVSQMGTDMMGQFAETQALDPVPGDIDPSQFFEGAWNTAVVDGTAYGVPWYVETRVLYYRSDLAEAAGISEAPATWDDLKAMATAMKEEGGAEWGISLGTKNWQEYVPFLWSNGGDIMNDSGEFTLNSPEAVEALTFYDSFFEEELSPKQVPEGFDITPAFVAGTHPMFFSGPWHLGLIEEAGGADLEGKWAISTLPTKVSGTSFVGGSNVVVFTDSENKDLGWEFVKFLSEPDTQVMWYEEATVLPAVKAGWEDPALSGDENLAVFGEQLASTKAPAAIPTWSEISEAINSNLERVTTGNTPPEEGAKAMQEQASSIGTE